MKSQGIFYRDAKISVGPGSYDVKPALSNIKFSMRPKTNLNLSPTGRFPGPGAYDVLPGITKDGRYSLSKFKASGASNFNPPSSKRFFELDKSKKIEFQAFFSLINLHRKTLPWPGLIQPQDRNRCDREILRFHVPQLTLQDVFSWIERDFGAED